MLVTSKDEAIVGFAGGGRSLGVAMWMTWLMARRRTAKFMSTCASDHFSRSLGSWTPHKVLFIVDG
jgi:hypothetical protein